MTPTLSNHLVTAALALLAGCQSLNDAASQAANDLQNGLQQAHDTNEAWRASTTPTVRGRVSLRDGQTLTCFVGIPSGYLGPRDLASPAPSSYDPRTRTISVRTAAIPAVVLTRGGTLIANECDKLAAEGVLEAVAGSAGAATATAAATARLAPRSPCSAVPVEQQSQYPRCVSFDRADPCSALPVDGTWLNGQTDLAAVCDSRKTRAVLDAEAAYQRSKAASAPGATARK